MSVNHIVGLLYNLQVLAQIGFTTEFGSVPKGATTFDPMVQAETANAMTMVDLLCSIAFNRISSMLHHSRGLPRYLTLLASPDSDIFRKALQTLVRDYYIYNIALEKAKASTFIAQLVKTSPFQARFVREIAIMATLQHPRISPSDRKERLQQYLYYVFTGWGQTNVVEDMF